MPCGFRRTVGQVWCGRHCLRTVLCGFRWTNGSVGMARPVHHAVQGRPTDGPVRGDQDCPRSVSCGFGWTDGTARAPSYVGSGRQTAEFGADSSAMTARTVPCRFKQTDSLVWGLYHGRDCPSTLSYEVGLTDGVVRGARHCLRTVRCWFWQTDGPVRGG